MAENQLGSLAVASSSATSAGGVSASKSESAASGNTQQAKAVSGSAGGAKKPKGSTFIHDYGIRNIKSYPITDAELEELFVISVVAAFCFSFATGLLGFAVNIFKDLSFNPALANETRDNWEYVSYGCIGFALVLFFVGVIVFIFGKSKISKIKIETEFKK